MIDISPISVVANWSGISLTTSRDQIDQLSFLPIRFLVESGRHETHNPPPSIGSESSNSRSWNRQPLETVHGSRRSDQTNAPGGMFLFARLRCPKQSSYFSHVLTTRPFLITDFCTCAVLQVLQHSEQ